ncbi:hypothetical protein EW026_g4592 [Hermanssonia centrifuga]|uniref:Polyketide synthase-like phosphopantetheine-binding domain-containing protein n=1 Tax=Hermanssonia centrifuga TaxID=98765 RepID=A0A4S4KID9_9APHY|nr:hypothetical protein EW026_g4592 [Hermanssonia centrifuga]
MPVFEELYSQDSSQAFVPLSPVKPTMDDPAIVMHSSGSTAFPKPITWSHYNVILTALAPYHGEIDMTGLKVACHATPMFHAMGVFQTLWATTCGSTMAVFKPQFPTRTPTPDLMMEEVMASKSDIIYCVPSLVEAWAKNTDHVRSLKMTKGVVFGGGPLSKEVGDYLVETGVNISMLYGCTEVGMLNTFLSRPGGKDWEYFTFPASVNPHLIPQENGNVRLVILPCQYQVPAVMNHSVSGVGAYDTNDVLSPHTKKPGYWKVYGRADDQIMHSNGEKTNPGPLENILQQDPRIQTAVMFGRGRFNTGVIIEPKPEFRLDPSDSEKVSQFWKDIWPTVDRMNNYAPQHSRLFREMILIASPSKPFMYTAKNNPRRHAIINQYEAEIEAVYATMDESASADIPPPPTWTLDSARDFVRAVVKKTLERAVTDTDDLFQNGCDSLQATWIRNSLLHALRETTKINTGTIPGNFVYNRPTIDALASFVAALTSSESGDSISDSERAITAMVDMVEKYSQNFPEHIPTVSAPQSDVIFLTGTSGRLGACLLAILVALPEVSRVYAVNRKSSTPILGRQRSILEEQGYDPDVVLGTGKVVFVDTSMEGENMGLPAELYEEIRTSVTHIIHNAWPVNFNMSLTTFEPSVRSVRRLVDLALSSPHPTPARLLFVSSVAILRQIDHMKPIKEGLVEPSVAEGTGYSESKWVSEQILARALNETPLRTVAVRVGQLSGSSISGAWKIAEWLPTLVRSSVHLQCLPDTDQQTSWIPVDVAARAINDMRKSDVPNMHLGHPRPVSWSAIMGPVAKSLNLPLVPYNEWFALLEKSGEGLDADSEVEMMHQNPGLKLLDFFRDTLDATSSSIEAAGLPPLDVTEALKVAPSLDSDRLAQMSGDDSLRWVGYWQKTGFLP